MVDCLPGRNKRSVKIMPTGISAKGEREVKTILTFLLDKCFNKLLLFKI